MLTNPRPLEIKKMLDDDHESDDLDVDMTAADVFVDRGLGQTDGRDQRGTLRVIQKPTPYSPARFPSVTLDWDAAAEDYERQVQTRKEAAANSVHKFPAIPEEGESVSGSQSSTSQQDDGQHTPTPHVASARQTDDLERRRDMPMMSVEKEDEIPGSPTRWEEQPQVQEQDSQDNNEKTIAATPQHRRFESQELGGSPTPTHPSAPWSEKATATSQPRASVSRGRAATRSINRVASESRSPSPAEQQRATEHTPPGRRKTRSQSRRTSQEVKPAEDDKEDEAEDGEKEDNEADDKEGEDGGEKDKSEDERDTEKDTESEDEEEGDRDEDGDVAMEDGDAADTTATANAAELEAPEKGFENDVAAEPRQTRLGKRKKSQEDLQSNKEPRLDRAGTPTQEIPESRSTSPSAMRKRERAPSFSGTGRRPSITEQHSPPRLGLGLGITKSPPRRKLPVKPDLSRDLPKPAKLDFSQDLTKSGEPPSSQTSVTAGHVLSSTGRNQNNLTPSKPQTPSMDKAKSLQSALRKDSPADKRRSVSFAEENNVIPATGGPRARSTPHSAAKEPKTKPNNKPPTPGKIVYPPGIPREYIDRIVEEENQKAREKAEFEQKMKEAEKRNPDPKYLGVLSDIHKTQAWIFDNEKSGRREVKEQVTKARNRLANQRRELEKIEAEMNGHAKTPEKKNKEGASKAAAEEKEETTETSTPSKDSGSAKKTRAARRESSSKRSTPAKSPAKEPETKQAPAAEKTTNGDSAPATEAEKPEQAADKPSRETPSQSKRKTSPAEKNASKTTTPASSVRPRRSRRSLRGTDAMDVDEPSQQEPEKEQQVNAQEKEQERDQDEEQGHAQSKEPELEPEPESEPQLQHEEQGEDERMQEQGQEPEQAEQPEAEPKQQPEPEKEPEPAQEPDPEQEQEAQSEQQPQEQPEQQPEEQPTEESEEQPQEPEFVPETSQPQEPQEPEPQPAEQSQQFRHLSQEQSQGFSMFDDVRLPEMETIRTVDQSKKLEEQPAPQPANGEPKATSQEQEQENESSSEGEDETASETGSGSDSSSDEEDEEEQGPEITKADLLRRANGTSSVRNSMTRSPAPSQQPPQSQPLPQNRYSSPRGSSQPPPQSQPHIQPFQSINGRASARASLQELKNMLTSQKQKHDAMVQQARQASTAPRKKDVFDPPSDSESEDESESDSDSDSDSESSADDGDIQSSGTVGKLRKALQKK